MSNIRSTRHLYKYNAELTVKYLDIGFAIGLVIGLVFGGCEFACITMSFFRYLPVRS